jgi:Flp pilus assembly pilin Flp
LATLNFIYRFHSRALTPAEAWRANLRAWEDNNIWGRNVIHSHLKRLKCWLQDSSGAAAVEYVVVAAALTTALIPGFYYVSSAVANKMVFITSFVLGS